MNTAGMVLAAGAGRRFGRPKAGVQLHGESFLTRARRLHSAGGCRPVLAVLGAAAEQIRDIHQLSAAEVIIVDGWREGIGASLRAGLFALPATADAVVLTLVDQPLITAEAIRAVRTAVEAGALAAVATYDGRFGHPVALHRAVFRDVAANAIGEVGARAWIRQHRDQVQPISCDGAGQPDDIDSPADLQRLLRGRSFDSLRPPGGHL